MKRDGWSETETMTKKLFQEVVSMQAPLAFQASIIGFEKLESHVWFTIAINTTEVGLPGKHYQIARTFRQFVEFSQQLRQEAQIDIPVLRPAKHFLTISLMTPHQKFEELARYLVQYSRLPQLLSASPLSRSFFGIHESDLQLNTISINQVSELPPLVRSTSDSSDTDTTHPSSNTTTGSGVKRSRSLSMRPFLDSARTALNNSRSVMHPMKKSISNRSLKEKFNTAPWNRTAPPSDDEAPLEPKVPTKVIAPWNIKNLDTADQAVLDQLKPVLPKVKTRLQLGERSLRMRDYENCMDANLPIDYLKIKVLLNSSQIIMLRVPTTIKFEDLNLKIKAKFLSNSLSCIPHIQNKLLAYKLSNKVYKLTNQLELDELMALDPQSISLGWIDAESKFINR
ncbi:hypothetical protein L0F63_004918 [Massospora cicadina]|nr:hypothetical protein L0F63_004918 [Massospora cicadina]